MVVLTVLAATNMFAQTFYVNNAFGNDANSGTGPGVGQAKATVSSALLASPSGSTISVAFTGITYTEATPGMNLIPGPLTPGVTGTYTFTSTGGTPIFSAAVQPFQVGTVALAGTITFTGPFQFTGLTLTRGTLAGANNITIAGGGAVYRSDLASITSGQLAFAGTATFNYENTATAVNYNMTIGLEFPTAINVANTLTTTATFANITLVLDQNRQINGLLTTGAGANSGGITLGAFTLTLSGGAFAHTIDGDVTGTGSLAFILTGAVSLDGVGARAITNVTASGAANTLTIDPAAGGTITTVGNIISNTNANITTNNTLNCGNITLNGAGTILTQNGTGIVGVVLGAAGNTGTIQLDITLAGTQTSTSITQSGYGNITWGANTNNIASGTVILNTVFTGSTAALGLGGLITFTDDPVVVGDVTNQAQFTGSVTTVAYAGYGRIIFGSTGATVSTGNLTSNVTGGMSAVSGGTLTLSGRITFATTAGNLLFGNITNSSSFKGTDALGGDIFVLGAGGTATVTASAVLNSSTVANANINFSVLTGTNTLASVTSSGATTGGDILFGNGNVVIAGNIANSRGAAGADIVFGTGGGSAATVNAVSILNSGASLINFVVTTTGAVSVTTDLSQTGTGTTQWPNATTATFTMRNVTLSLGTLFFGNGTGNLIASGNVLLTAGTVNWGTGAAHSFTIGGSTGINTQFGGVGTVVTMSNGNNLNIIFFQPIPNVNQYVTLSTINQTFNGQISVTNPAVIPAPYVIFKSADPANVLPGNLYILNLGLAADALTFNTPAGVTVQNTVQLDNARLYIGMNNPAGIAGGNFQNTSGYSTINGGFVMMNGNAPQSVNTVLANVGATFGNFGVDNNALSLAANADVAILTASTFTGDFYLAEGSIANTLVGWAATTNVVFNGTGPNWPTIYRTEGSFRSAPTFSNLVNVTYYGNDKATSVELPVAANRLNNLTVATTNGASPGQGIIAMTTTPVTVNGTLTINANQSLYTGANNLILNGTGVIVNGYLVDDGTTRVQLAKATGITFTGNGILPALQVNNGSLGNTVTGYAGLVSDGFGGDGVWAGVNDFATMDGNIAYEAGVDAGSSLTVNFNVTVNPHFGSLIMNSANETFTLAGNATMSLSIAQTGGTINLGGFTLTHKGIAFATNGTPANGSVITNGTLAFVTTPTTLTVAGAPMTIAANVTFTGAAASTFTLPAASFNLTINGNVTLSGTGGANVRIDDGRTLTLGGASVTVNTASLFSAGPGLLGTGILLLNNATPNDLLTFTTPVASAVANLTIAGNVTLAGAITGSTLTVGTAFIHNSGLFTFGSADLQINGTFTRNGGTYAGDGWLIYSGGAAGFQHSAIVAADVMSINKFQLTANMTLQNARNFNIIKNLYLNGGTITNQVAASGPGYIFLGDASNVPLIRVLEPSDVLVNALQFNSTNADYTFNGPTASVITATVWPATTTLARNVIVNMAAFGNTLTIPSKTINGNLTLTTGVLTWDNPVIVTIASGSTITRNVNGALNKDASGAGATGTLTAPNVNLIFTGVGIGNTGIEYSDPVIVNNLTLGLPDGSTLTLNSARTVAGVVAINGATSVLTVAQNTTFSAAQNITTGTIAVVATKTLTLGAASTLPTVTGNVTTTSALTLAGGHSLGIVSIGGDFTVSAGATLAATSNLVFNGATNATFTVPNTNTLAGTTIGALTFEKTNNVNRVTLAGGNITTGALTTFINGLFVTGTNTFNMWVPAFGDGQGFIRVGVTGTNISHVVGNVAKTLFNGGGNPATACEPRQEFPVGSITAYKLVAITFNPAFGLATVPNATLTVNAFDGSPGGAVGLPIIDGVATGIDVARYPNFYWTIVSSPFSIGPTTPFDLELSAAGFIDYDAIANVRIIRRYGAVADVANDWLLQGLNTSYDNSLNGTTPTIIQRGANAGLRVGGAVFTLGVKSNLSVKTAIPKQWLVLTAGAKNYSLANVFQGNIGPLSFTSQSSNINVATAAVLPPTSSNLRITPLAIGDAVVTVTAIDADGHDSYSFSFDVNVGLTDVAEDAIPTEFALYQNFPNPFNPTTNIKFALPKEANVTLRIFNILGQEVSTLVNKVMPAGFHTVDFNATKLSSGMYIYRIEAGEFVQVRKMLLMK